MSLDFHLAQYYVCMLQTLESRSLITYKLLQRLKSFIVEWTYAMEIIKIEIGKFFKKTRKL